MDPPKIREEDSRSSFIGSLFEPSVPVDTREERRNIVFQSKILFSVIVIIPFFILWMLSYTPPEYLLTDINFLLGLIVLVVFTIGFYLSKRDMVETVSIIIVFVISSSIFAVSIHTLAGLSEMYSKDDVNVLLFLIIPILLTVTLFDIKRSSMIICLIHVVILAFPFFFPHLTLYDMAMGPLLLLGMFSIFLLSFSHHQKKLEEDRRKDIKSSEEKLKSMLASTPDGIILTDLNGNVINCNETIIDMMGYGSKEELVGMDIFSFISSDEISKAAENFKRTLEDGSTRNVEYKIERKDGTTFHAVLSSSVIRDADGEPKALIGTVKDITRRKESKRWEKLLDSVLSNDIRRGNQLINGYLELVLESDLDPTQKKMVEKALSSAKDQSELIHKIDILRNLGKDYSHGRVDPYFILDKSIDLYAPKMKKQDIEFSADIKETGSKVVSEGRGGVLIESVFNSLLDSVIEYSNADSLKIKTEETEDAVVVSFIDDGDLYDRQGISDIMRDYVDRDSMSKYELNLYLIKNIVETYGGKIRFRRSEVGGARFEVFLKKAD